MYTFLFTNESTLDSKYNLNKCIDISLKNKIRTNMKETLPIILQKVSAGFPSPATDYIEEEINLNNELIKNPSSTFLIRVQGNSMLDYKIAEGDVLIVDRSLTLKNNSIAVLNFQGELVVKRIVKKKEKYFILSKENKRTKEIEISSSFDSELWGIVIYVIHKL